MLKICDKKIIPLVFSTFSEHVMLLHIILDIFVFVKEQTTHNAASVHSRRPINMQLSTRL